MTTTTGGKPRLLGISKRGNRYLRENLIHGSRPVLPRFPTRTRRSAGGPRVAERAPKNVVIVALANKLAGIV